MGANFERAKVAQLADLSCIRSRGVFCSKCRCILKEQWFAKILLALSPPDCVVKPRRCAASPAFYAWSADLMPAQSFSQTTVP